MTAQPAIYASSHQPAAKVARPAAIVLVLLSRTVLFLLGFFLTAGIFSLTGSTDALAAARPWWPVNGLLVNAACLALLLNRVKAEGRDLASLIVFDRSKMGRDLRSSLWMILLSIVLAVGATMGLGGLLYQFRSPNALMSMGALPVWALVISLGVFPLINAFVEEMTYNGYVFPRLEAHTGVLQTVIWITLVFSLQHISFPFVFDARFLLWRFLSFVPLLLFWVLAYRKYRRLTALIVTHWFMDVFALLTILFVPVR